MNLQVWSITNFTCQSQRRSPSTCEACWENELNSPCSCCLPIWIALIVVLYEKKLFWAGVLVFAQQMGPHTHGGWVGATRSTSTGGAQRLASRNVPVAWTGTALTQSTTATVMLTTSNGECCSEQTVNMILTVFPRGFFWENKWNTTLGSFKARRVYLWSAIQRKVIQSALNIKISKTQLNNTKSTGQT